MTRKYWFQIGIAILLTLLIIKFLMEISFIFSPFAIIFKTILLPVIFGGALFYLVEPIQRKLEEKGLPRWGSILIILFGMSIALTIIIVAIAPKVNSQINSLVENFPAYAATLNDWRIYIMNQVDHLPDQIKQSLISGIETIESSAGKIGSGVLNVLQGVTSAMLTLVLVPFFFIFILKDHEKFAPQVYGWFSGSFRAWLEKTLADIDEVLRSYIQGQMIISALLATLLLIGYSIVGLEYALLLSVFALFMNIIPFFGPWIAFVPAAIIAVLQDPKMIIWVSIITLVAQQIDSQLITPNIMGKSLNIHPLTIITLLLAAGSIAGFLGILLAIPTYAVIRAIIRNIYSHRKMIKAAMTREL